MDVRRAAVPAAVIALALFTGCAVKAPHYQPSVDTVDVVKRSRMGEVSLGSFVVESQAPGLTSVSLRGNSMTSPVGNDYAAYLAEALRRELSLAGKLNAASQVVVSGVLLRNDVEAGIGSGTGQLEARFKVMRDGRVAYEKSHSAQSTWESSFAGPVAIPKAIEQYPLVVQKLVAALLRDPDFNTATAPR